MRLVRGSSPLHLAYDLRLTKGGQLVLDKRNPTLPQ